MKYVKVIKYGLIIVSIIFLIMLSLPYIGEANQSSDEEPNKEWNKLNELAEQVLYLSQKNEFEAAKKQLGHLSNFFLSLNTGDFVQRIEQVQVLTETIIQAEEAFNRVSPNSEEIEHKLLKLRLVIDAVSHKRQPLWLNYYPTIVQTMDELYAAAKDERRDSFYHYINQLANQHEFIRPALVISHDGQTVEKIDSKMKFLMTKRSELWQDNKNRLAFIEGMEGDWKRLFYQADEENSLSFIYLTVGMAVLICSVLTYVAWRKYKGEKEIKKVVWKK